MTNLLGNPIRLFTAVAVLLGLLAAGEGPGLEEGFWRPESLPLERLAEQGFRPPPGLLDRIGGSTLRIADSGGSAVIVSPEGLVVTAHHLVRDRIASLGSRGSLLLDRGFLALRPEREIPLPGLRLERLVGTIRIGERIDEAVAARVAEEGPAVAEVARARAIQDLVDAESTRSGLLVRVSAPPGAGLDRVLQRFVVHRDVRLVFVPELDLATFGGDDDNFHFPRYSLDAAVLRIYEDGEPLATPDHLSLSARGGEPDEPVLLAGYPAAMGRLLPPALVRRDIERFHPAVIRLYDGMIRAHADFARRGESEERLVAGDLVALANGRKAYAGRHRAMLERGGLARMEARWRAQFGSADDEDPHEVHAWTQRLLTLLDEIEPLRRRRLFSRLESPSLGRAKQLLGYAQALSEFEEGDPQLDERRAALLADVGSDPGLEAIVASERLELARAELGGDDPFVRACDGIAGEEGLATALGRSRLRDLAFRSRLVAAGPAAIVASDDPFIRLARALEDVWVELWGAEGRTRDAEIAKLEDRIAAAAAVWRHPRSGPEPDGSLRLSFGRLNGFERAGSPVPAVTSLWGLFGRHRAMRGVAPYALPISLLEARDRLDLDGNVNFAITADVGRGSSGGPVLDREGRVIGLLFDLNFENLGQHFVHGDEAGRGIAVDSSYLLAILRGVYEGEQLADELLGAR